jgi:hypothetical protein
MAISKKEQKRFDDITQELRLLSAFHLTAKAEPPDVPRPKNSSDFLCGYTINEYTRKVLPSLTKSHYHGTNFENEGFPNKTTTQGGLDLFSSKLKALRALRNLVERQCCEMLLAVDEKIEKELGKE